MPLPSVVVLLAGGTMADGAEEQTLANMAVFTEQPARKRKHNRRTASAARSGPHMAGKPHPKTGVTSSHARPADLSRGSLAKSGGVAKAGVPILDKGRRGPNHAIYPFFAGTLSLGFNSEHLLDAIAWRQGIS